MSKLLRRASVAVALATLTCLTVVRVAHADDGGDAQANCSLTVPPAPLTAAGLMTPYQLAGTDDTRCHEDNLNQAAFVEATILDPNSGKLSIYRPVVVDKGDDPAMPPVPVKLPPNAVVGVWFGFQGQKLTLRGDTAGCVNGLDRSVFGGFAYCGAPEFFKAAHAAVRAGKLTIPPLGTARDGRPCPTTRDFAVVDQDQSDNLDTTYRVRHGRIAQDTGQDGDQGGRLLTNASDNALLTEFLDPAIGCTPFRAPDLTAGGRLTPSLALNELQAGRQANPVALVPPSDPMTLVGKRRSIEKTNLYRAGTDQPPLAPGADPSRGYCTDLRQIAPERLRAWEPFTRGRPTPVKDMGRDLSEFLRNRLKTTLQNLNCDGDHGDGDHGDGDHGDGDHGGGDSGGGDRGKGDHRDA